MGADPYGRHKLRYWDGRQWTDHVSDGSVAGRDPIAPPGHPGGGPREPLGNRHPPIPYPPVQSTPRREVAPSPLLSGRMHTLLAVLTCGLWLIVAPAIYWARRRAFVPLVSWSAVWLVLFAIGAVTDGTTPSTSAAPVASPVASSPTPSTSEPTRGAPLSEPKPTTQDATTRPTPTKSLKPKPRTATTTARPKPKPKPSPEPGSGNVDPRFDTCKEAKANGYGPYTQGVDPEYSWYRDADGDGKNCE